MAPKFATLLCHFITGTIAIALGVVELAAAAEFCVHDADELYAVLYDTETNKQDDTIKLTQGLYRGNFSYRGEAESALTLDGGYTLDCTKRAIAPARTVLDGGLIGRTFHVINTGGGKLDIRNLTVRRGDPGGLSIDDASHSVVLNRVRVMSNHGWGAYIANGKSATVTRSIFQNNQDRGLLVSGLDRFISLQTVYLDNSCIDSGGGLHANGIKNIAIRNSIFKRNSSDNSYGPYAGGAYLGGAGGKKKSRIVVSNSQFESNWSTAGYAGILVESNDEKPRISTTLITNNKINGNHAGGIGVIGFKTATIQGNMVQHNDGYGAAVSVRETDDARLINNLVSNNIVDTWNSNAAAVTVSVDTGATLINNTIVKNTKIYAHKGGGGLGIYLYSHPENDVIQNAKAVIHNNIIWGNKATIGADVYIENDFDDDLIAAPVELYSNNFNRSRPSGFFSKRYIPLHSSNLNNQDPLFVDVKNGDFHLRTGSPLIDKGNDSSPLLPLNDLDGKPRVVGAGVDLGAFESR